MDFDPGADRIACDDRLCALARPGCPPAERDLPRAEAEIVDLVAKLDHRLIAAMPRPAVATAATLLDAADRHPAGHDRP
eukprot:gene34167-43826_t